MEAECYHYGKNANACNLSKIYHKTTNRIDNTWKSSSSSGSDTENDKRKANQVLKAKYGAHVWMIGRARHTTRHKKHKKSNYQVEIGINGKKIIATADTGAEICVISKYNAKALVLPLHKTRMKIKSYGSSSLKCKGVHMGPVICGEAAANLKIYVVNRDVDTLLSRPASGAIIKFNEELAPTDVLM